MGQWHISIEGTGQHHNYDGADANVMTYHFVAALRRAGHSINKVSFTYGASDPVDSAAWHPENKPDTRTPR